MTISETLRRPAATRPDAGRTWWSTWVLVTGAGVLVGLVAPAAAAVLAAHSTHGLPLMAVVVGGLAEGAVLGWSQARVLATALDDFDPGAWIRATACGTAVVWCVTLSAAASHDRWSEWSPWSLIFGAAGLAALLFGTVGWLQARTLRTTRARRYRWTACSAAALATGVAAAGAVVVPTWARAASVTSHVGTGLLGGLVLATVVAAVTGVGALDLVPPERRGHLGR